MTSITQSLSNLLSALTNILHDLLTAILSVFQSVFAVFTTLLASIYDTLLALIKGSVNLVEDVFKFFFNNFLILAVLGAALVGWVVYSQKQGRAGTTMTQKKRA
ncbi:MAG: hypothetical protein M1834_006111 [Cirrosporium novae-zelandiae]|nr:MAG: hypothetical protein M1834_006111 [Cirrosporium novae-zelandiae]